MKVLETFISTPLAGVIGWTLLHSLWQGALISAALAAAMFPTRSARLRYATACAAMLAMLGGFGYTLVHMMPDSPHDRTILAIPSTSTSLPTALESSTSWRPTLAAIVPWLAPLWIGGVFMFYLRQLAGFVLVQRLRRQGACQAPQRWQSELARLAAQMRLSRPVQLMESCIAETPVVLGHFRPVILLPLDLLTRLPAGQIEAILLHELAHIRRHDYLVNVLQRLIEGLLFYHPAVWWISQVIRAERENCCDDVVVSIRGDAHEYALALAALEQHRGPGRELAIAVTGGNLVTRVRRLLYPQEPNGAWTPVLTTVILIATLSATLAAWPAAPPQSTQLTSTAVSPYAKWLNEDVVYIIDPLERAAFEKLTTDEEREQFIQQFWERRNPTPGSPANAAKKEHYRRIGYANELFRSATSAGWRTDRGRMYISYGPPDEREVHPNQGAARFAREVWLYHQIKGIGTNVTLTFVDRAGRGDYQLAPGKSP